MVKQKYIIGLGFLIAVLIIAIQFQIIHKSYSEGSQKGEKANEPIELAELMFHNLRYMDKLYFSGLNDNWEAAEFYHHEIEENMEVLLEGNIVEDSLEMSKLANVIFTPASLELKNSIITRNQEVFLKGYKIMVNSCNNCHNATRKGFLKIALPDAPAFKNQDY